jgi:hypothetical protein
MRRLLMRAFVIATAGLAMASLAGAQEVVYSFPLDDDPGWTIEGQWAFGVPTGQGGSSGGPDPTSGYTGDNVYGYNLDGDYPNGMDSTMWLTTPALDFTGYCQVRLEFWRWLGIEDSRYDHAWIQVSSDGETWLYVWHNPPG